MKNKIIYSFMVLCVLNFPFNLNATPKKATDNKNKFLVLVDESTKSKNACNTYNEELNKIAVTEFKPGAELYKDRDTALAVIKKLLEHPGTPRPSYDAFKVLYSLKEKEFTEEWLIHGVEKIEYFCQIFHFYNHLKNLVIHKDEYKLTSTELDDIKKIIFKFVSAESVNPNLAISSMMQITLLDLLDANKLLSPHHSYKEDIAKLKGQAKLIRDKFLKSEGSTAAAVGKHLYMEFQESKKISKDIHNLFATIQKVQH